MKRGTGTAFEQRQQLRLLTYDNHGKGGKGTRTLKSHTHTQVPASPSAASPASRGTQEQEDGGEEMKEGRYIQGSSMLHMTQRPHAVLVPRIHHHIHTPPRSQRDPPPSTALSLASHTYLPGSFRPMSRNSGRGRCCWYCGCPYACASAVRAKQKSRRTGEKDARPQQPLIPLGC